MMNSSKEVVLPNPFEHCTPEGKPKGKFTYKVDSSYEDFWAKEINKISRVETDDVEYVTKKEPSCVEFKD